MTVQLLTSSADKELYKLRLLFLQSPYRRH